jgi:hypothetical protein
MSLPFNDILETALASVGVVVGDRPTGCDSEEIAEPETVVSSNGLPIRLFLIMTTAAPLSLRALVDRVRASLSSAGHVSSHSNALATLALFSETRDSNTSAIQHWNDCVTSRMGADLTFWVVLPHLAPRGLADDRIGPFRYGAIDVERLEYRLKIAKSSLRTASGETLEPAEWRGRLCLEREPTSTQVIDWQSSERLEPRFTAAVSRRGVKFITLLLDRYYATFAGGTFSTAVVHDLRETQLLLEAAGLSFMHDDLTRMPLSRCVSLFLWRDRRADRGGWVNLLMRDMIGLRDATGEFSLAAGQRWLEQHWGAWQIEDSPRMRVVATFARFLARARRHKASGRQDEALLHFVIALDLVFGLEGAASSRIAGRASVVTHKPCRRTLAEQRARLRTIYDARSRYVHEGRPTSREQLDEAEQVCVEVLWAMLRAARLLPESQATWIDQWHRQLDFLEAALEAGRIPDVADLVASGIASDALRRP